MIDFDFILIAQSFGAIDNYFTFIEDHNNLKPALMLRSMVHSQTEINLLYNYFTKKKNSAKLIINTFLNLPANVYHLNSNQLKNEKFIQEHVLKSEKIFGASCHNPHEIRLAEQYKLDYITLSPIYKTKTHLFAKELGLDRLNTYANNTKLKVFALGGVNLLNLSDCINSGAFGGASVSLLEEYRHAGL